jgi:predicted homoserine dehydrogenase-like protein
MIIVDKALAERAAAGDPIRVGLVGAGFMGRSIARQIIERVPGMNVVAIANRTLARAQDAYAQAGLDDLMTVETAAQLDTAVGRRQPVVTDDPSVLVESAAVEAVIEATGTVEFAARVALSAIENGKHVILSNAELDGTVGPVLKSYADAAGVVLTDIDGDQPGAELNAFRFVRGIGLTPVLCGNIKGLLDHYRTPETQRRFAEQWGQAPYMVTSFADGSKISFEQAVVANATGMSVACRGMRGLEYHGHVEDPDHLALWDADELRRLGGIVDYTLGARPGAGVYVLAVEDDPVQRTYLDLYKMGEGPLYCFCVPYHLCYMEVPFTVARAVLYGDAAVSPLGHFVDVVATAKRDLRAGEKLDGIGGYMSYGQCENADVAQRERLLPIGVAEGCVLLRDVARDTVLTYDDVELPQGRTSDRLRVEQREMRRGHAEAA